MYHIFCFIHFAYTYIITTEYVYRNRCCTYRICPWFKTWMHLVSKPSKNRISWNWISERLIHYGAIAKKLHKHDDVIKWKHFPRYWPFVRGIHRSSVNSPHKGQWREALMFSLMCAWTKRWVNNREAGDLRRHQAHYDTSVMKYLVLLFILTEIYLM